MTASHLLEVKDLTVDFLSLGGAFRATNGVSFHVDAGETLVILGESGSGKSVSASAIMGLIDTPPGDICSGTITYRGRNVDKCNAEERRDLNGKKIAMIFQDPLSHLNPVYPIGWQLAEVFSAHGLATGAEARAKAIDILGRVGIPEPEKRIDQYPHQFSGGQRQRIMIGMAIALRPEILIADEPTTALDVSVQAQILDLLKKLQAEDGLAIIMITHDLEVAASMADRVIVMNSGRIVEEGEARAVFENPQHSYTRTLINALPHDTAEGASRRSTVEAGKPILEVKNLNKFYGLSSGFFAKHTQLHAVKDLSFNVAKGETVGIVGESGSGKSTVARVLLRLNEVSSGQALFHGRDIFQMDAKELLTFRRKVQMVFQDPYSSMNPRMTIFDIVSEPWRIHKDILDKPRWRDRVVELLDLVGLKPEHADRYPHQFSGGQRQRIAIARALACEPELIVCDEAVSALDVSVQIQVIDLLAQLRDRLGLAYIFITHDLPIVRHFADRIIVMKSGAIVEHARTDDIFRNPQHPYTRQLMNATPKPKWETEPATVPA
ncbi:ABC transporter ATP-binding protein [Mycoplana rhizolycopersici]|uniref:ABC transporter ATP-binding protein n=1 Tax=Mycoplana rhizolycopersici TaxID=2746702 RepID=A0ABX2QKY7_9HYPH|nr:ABC transporter ATP-binding protein [Rhizobium rhizolycopersici]NVP58460.1 ABC transporter ATP-binding protein [Rhizobium rhizolycopersici]